MGVVGQKWRTSGYHCIHVSEPMGVRRIKLAYLVHNIFKRVGAVDGEADEQQVGLGV